MLDSYLESASSGQDFNLSADQLKGLSSLLARLHPWEEALVTKLFSERAELSARLKITQGLLNVYRDLPKEGFEDSQEQTTCIPAGYSIEHCFQPGGFFRLYRQKQNFRESCGEFELYDEALNAALKHDRESNPYGWRAYSQTCPPNEMLLFTCTAGLPSKDGFPVRTGYRDGNSYKIFGVNWKPTHWTYQPDFSC